MPRIIAISSIGASLDRARTEGATILGIADGSVLLPRELSANGLAPASHNCGTASVTDAQMTQITALPPGTFGGVVVNLDTDVRPPQQVITDMGLQLIN